MEKTQRVAARYEVTFGVSKIEGKLKLDSEDGRRK